MWQQINQQFVKHHSPVDGFRFGALCVLNCFLFGDEATQLEATPALAIERGEKLHFPPALVFQGDRDQWTSVAQAEQLAARYRAAGGNMELLLLPGERHTFLNEHPFSPNAIKAFEAVKGFIKKHG